MQEEPLLQQSASALGLWKDRVMMNVIGMTAIGFLVCMAVVKIADMAVSGWLSGDGRRP